MKKMFQKIMLLMACVLTLSSCGGRQYTKSFDYSNYEGIVNNLKLISVSKEDKNTGYYLIKMPESKETISSYEIVLSSKNKDVSMATLNGITRTSYDLILRSNIRTVIRPATGKAQEVFFRVDSRVGYETDIFGTQNPKTKLQRIDIKEKQDQRDERNLLKLAFSLTVNDQEAFAVYSTSNDIKIVSDFSIKLMTLYNFVRVGI